ncbi:MAG: hypothetical protein ACYC4H_00860 [Desulfocucumaceae bacterium]
MEVFIVCKCTPNIRTPFCGRPGCEWPKKHGVKEIKEAFKTINLENRGTDEEYGEVILKELKQGE